MTRNLVAFAIGFLLVAARASAVDTFDISEEQRAQAEPAVGLAYVAWKHVDDYFRPTISEIWLYDIRSGQSRVLDDEFVEKSHPRISGDRVFWLEAYGGYYGYPSYKKIVAKNVITGRKTTCLDVSSSDQVIFSFDVFGDYLAWIEDTPGPADPRRWDNSGWLHLTHLKSKQDQTVGPAGTRVSVVHMWYDWLTWSKPGGGSFLCHVPTASVREHPYLIHAIWGNHAFYARSKYTNTSLGRVFQEDVFAGSRRMLFDTDLFVSHHLPRAWADFVTFYQELGSGGSYDGQVWAGKIAQDFAFPLTDDLRGTCGSEIYGNTVVWSHNHGLVIKGARVDNVNSEFVLRQLSELRSINRDFPLRLRRWLAGFEGFIQWCVRHGQYRRANVFADRLQQHLGQLYRRHRLPEDPYWKARNQLWAIDQTTEYLAYYQN